VEDFTVLTKYADICDRFSILVVDPFDLSYTPARQLKIGENLDNEYYRFMLETLDSLLYDGELFVDLTKVPPKKTQKFKGDEMEPK
jgi:hypothetical protein